MAIMLECPACKKNHRADGEEAFEAKVEKCWAAVEKREAREAAKRAEFERRALNAAHLPPAKLIEDRVNRGMAWVNILAEIKRDYPPPAEGRQWDLYDVVRLDAPRMSNWPTDPETVTLLRLEKIMTGEFISCHPLALPMDGSFSLVEQARPLQPEINWAENMAAFHDAERKRRAKAEREAAARPGTDMPTMDQVA